MSTFAHDSRRGAGRIMMTGAWIGLTYGLLEGVGFTVLAWIPGGMSWGPDNSETVLWVAPLFYGPLYALVAWVLASVLRWLPFVPRETVVVGSLAGVSAFAVTTIPGASLNHLAVAAVVGVVALESARRFHRGRVVCRRRMRASLGYLATAVGVLALSITGWHRMSEELALSNLPPAAGGRPNVLLVVLDSVRADRLGLHGYERETTPHLDALGRDGVAFTKAHAGSSWTLPSHATLMTGLRLSEHHAGDPGRPFLGDSAPTLAEVLRQHGYATGGFVGNTEWCGRQTGLHRGFLHYADFYGNAVDAIARTALGRWLWYEVGAKLGWRDIPGRKSAHDINDAILSWVDGLGAGHPPFFVFANYLDAHAPYLPPDPFAGRWASRSPDFEEGMGMETISRETDAPPPVPLQHLEDSYDEAVAYLDEQLGALFAELKQRGLLDETLVIVTSDHGESFGEHGRMDHGHSLSWEQTHVPLLIRFPKGVPSGRRVDLATGLDRVAATVVDLCGIEDAPFPGASLREYWVSGGGASTAVLTEVSQRSNVGQSWPTSRGWCKALVTGRWHFLMREGGEVELYDTVADPREERDLADTEQGRRVVEELRARVDRAGRPRGREPWPAGPSGDR